MQNTSGFAALLKGVTTIEDAVHILSSRPVEGEMDIPHKYWYYNGKGKLITSTLGQPIHSPLSEMEILREALNAVFFLAMNTKLDPADRLAFNLPQVRDLTSVGVGNIRPLTLKEIARYAFSENAHIGNGHLATPARASLVRIVKVFPSFQLD